MSPRSRMAALLITVALTLTVGQVAPVTPQPKPLVPVSVAVPVPAVPFLPLYIAKQKGFDRENGVEINFQTIAGSVAVQAMVSGGLDFTLSAGSVLNAGLAGAPVAVLMIMIDKSTYALYARPEIRGVQDLKGKKIAVDSIGGSQYSELRLALEKAGLSPADVVILGISGTVQIASLSSGAIDGSVVAPPQDLQLEKLGFRRVLKLGDYVAGINGGLGVSASLLKSKPDVVDGLVTAGLMGLRYLKENREGTLPLIMSYLSVDARDAGFVYDTTVQAFSDGRSSPPGRAEMIAAAAAALKSPPRRVQPEEIFDFGPLDRAQARLQARGWRPN